MRAEKMLPAHAGIGSNDPGAAQRADRNDVPQKQMQTETPRTTADSPKKHKQGFRPGVGPKFPAGI